MIVMRIMMIIRRKRKTEEREEGEEGKVQIIKWKIERMESKSKKEENETLKLKGGERKKANKFLALETHL